MLGAEALPSLDRISKVSLGMTESVAILVSHFWALFRRAVKGNPSARTSCQAIAYKIGSVRDTANNGASDDQGSRGVNSACVHGIIRETVAGVSGDTIHIDDRFTALTRQINILGAFMPEAREGDSARQPVVGTAEAI